MRQKCNLGGTSVEVTPIGLGCWQFSRSRGLAGRYWPALPQATVRDIVRVSLEGGINWFDTAEVYGNGASEQSLAEALADLGAARQRYVLADKWFPGLRTARSIRATFPRREHALERIAQPGTVTIDLHQIHQPFSLSSVERQMDQMAALVDEGRIRAVGVSNFNHQLMRRAHRRLAASGIPLATNQMRYNLLDREIERNGVLDTAAELGITIIAYSPLAQGVLTGKFHGGADGRAAHGPRKWLERFKPDGLDSTRPLVDALHAVAAACRVTAAQVALAWVVQRHATRVVAIPGATSVDQARSNSAALSVELTAGQIEELDYAGREAEARLKGL